MSDSTPSKARQITIGVVLLGVVAAISGLGGLANAGNTDGWYADVDKVVWDPPNSIFAPAWTTLYIVIAIVGFLLWRAGYQGDGQPNRARKPLIVFGVQLALNAAWSPTFFASYPVMGEPAWWLALLIIVALIICVVWLMTLVWPWSKGATWLLVPYTLWLTYASTLNAGVIVLN